MRSDRERLLDMMEAIERHDYFCTDVVKVWATVENDLPVLKARVLSILSKLESEK